MINASREGAQMRMLHPYGHARARPVDVPIVIGALRPRATKWRSASAMACTRPSRCPTSRASTRPGLPYLVWGRVLDGEGTGREHARLLADPSWDFADHGAYEFGGPSAVPAPTGSVE